MDLDQRLCRKLATAATATTTLRHLAVLHSLIKNPSTSAATIATVVETLTTTTADDADAAVHLHLLSFLPRTHQTTAAASATTLLSSPSPRLAAAALSLLVDSPGQFRDIDDGLIVSLPFRPSIAVRVWWVNNAGRFGVGTGLLVSVLLGFSKDPYPNVREGALVGLARVCEDGIVVEEDSSVVEACYFRAVELLSDQEGYVRRAAVRAAGEWGRMLAALKEEGVQRDWYDAVFLQLCSSIRDMDVEVRVEAINALGKFAYVSEDILLQSLSKKVLKTVKEKQSLALCNARQHKIHASTAAGAFVHGLEDEFSQVQQAACITLRMLPVMSRQFAGEAVNILSYVLNDDSIIVRLEALKTLHHMVKSGCPKLQEEHIDMILGTLVDSCPKIRSTAISIVGFVKLPTPKLSKITVESLLQSLDMYPKSEADIFHALFSIGQNNGHHSVSIIEDLYHEVEPSGDRKFGCNNHKVAGLIVFAVSASLKHESLRSRIPQKIFSYAAAYFGRISHAFADILDADSLLQHLTHYGNWCPEAQSKSTAQALIHSAAKDNRQTSVLVLDNVKLILATVKSLWGLIKCGCICDVLRALRCCKGSMRTLKAESIECAGLVAFALQYIHIVKLLSKIWHHFTHFGNPNLNGVGELDILLAKLEKSVLAVRFRFSGFGEVDEFYLLELVLLSYVLTLSSSSHVRCRILPKLRTTIGYVDNLRTITTVVSSDFVNQLSDFSSKGIFGDPSTLKKLCYVFTLGDLTPNPRIKEVHGELVVIGFDLVSPLRFIPRLPVGIPLDITLYNITSDHVVWLELILVDAITEYVFLDMEEFGDVQEVKQVLFTAPFYRTPKTAAFTLRVNMGIECKSEKLGLVKGYGGPKHALTYISPEIEVFFVNSG